MIGPAKKVKIVATVGPASSSPQMIGALLSRGVDVFRLNFSHGTHDFADSVIHSIREQSKILGIEVGILADLQGPKIRTGVTRNNLPVTITDSSLVRITTNQVESTEKLISIDYQGPLEEIKQGSLVMINDGAIRLRVEEVDGTGILHCIVLSGGTYSSHKGVNFPDVDLSIPSLTSKDKNDLSFILQKEVQYIALSFVRKAADIENLRQIIYEQRSDIKVIAKIEKPEAARRIEEILNCSDGIMVARGDLGVEASPYAVPILQKELIDTASRLGKLVIVATQMLESMIQKRLPTRAESTDVANAIIDGTDAIMLSGETAIGLFPAESVETMVLIADLTERSQYVKTNPLDLSLLSHYPPHAICEAAAWASRDLGSIPIAIFTVSGETAFYLSKIRSQSPLYAFSPDNQTVRVLSLAWNVRPFYLPFSNDILELQAGAERTLLNAGLLKNGDLIAIVSGTTPVKGATNSLQIKRVGQF